MTPKDILPGWEEKFDEDFGDEIVERFHEYYYTEGYNSPLLEAKKFAEKIKERFRETLTSSRKAYQEELRGKIEDHPMGDNMVVRDFLYLLEDPKE